MKDVTLSKERFLNAITFSILLVLIVFVLVVADHAVAYPVYKSIVNYMSFFSLVTLITMSRRVSIVNGEIVKGIHVFVFVFKKERFPLAEIDDVMLNQNDDLYYEIVAKSKKHSDFIISKFPNKNPARKQLELIKRQIEIE
ncbi:MAG: hypothetical protein ACJAZK_001816 [Psychroserpens sp.]|jgi:hypothetical protein|uniref:hypothetical protein n=1 Tax=Psychroserpens sp. TaxID=2020870 RepID=UPI0039E2F91F